MIKVHGVSASPFVRKVLAVMAIKELPFEHIAQMPFNDDAEYRKISPLGKVPTLEDGDLVVNDSKVICQYLEDAYPQPPVYPTDHRQKSKARWYEELGGTRVAELAAGIFFQRFLRPVILKQETDEALVESLINDRLPPMLDYLESQVPADGFIFGDLGVADIALASPFVNASYAGYNVDAGRWPGFAGFYGRVVEHPVVAPLLEADVKALGLAR